tara:strand:+ start:687 stop:1253 length:567 start_codon:yes stop_codon:yes gene_type:complete
MVKIIAGLKKGLKLNVPNNNVRPTSALKRESIFSVLESKSLKLKKNIYKNKYCLDLFAGSGALGLEAISRGAKYCYFYDLDQKVIKILEKNCKNISEKNKYNVIKTNIINSTFKEIKYKISVIFIDPPYKFLYYENLLKKLALKEFITKETIFIVESNKSTKINFPKSLNIDDEKYYGKTKITYLFKV